jgi:uncharacterized flavoprotein (TIGR03862 family)
MAAEVLATAGVAVTVHERMRSMGRRFQLAGRGGLNLTHSEPLEAFLSRYGAARERLTPAITAFPPDALREWAAGLGHPSFVGTSGRVFPTELRATGLLRSWLGRLRELGVELRTGSTWPGDADGADATVLALGGASWPRVGADGAWVPALRSAGVEIAPLRPANCGVVIGWSPAFHDRFEGQPVKDVELRAGDARCRGDVVVTRSGLEGGAVYPLVPAVRDALPATLTVDLRPDVTLDQLLDRLGQRRPKDSVANVLRRLGLAAVAIALLREGGGLPSDSAGLAARIKATPLTVTALPPLDRAISTAGGIAWSEVDEHLMLCKQPGTFVAGEMLDWEAPTGGYLLQACFSTGVAAAHGAARFLSR